MAYSIKDILLDLVSVQSDTGTRMEIDEANRIFYYLRNDRYFIENPELCGMFCGDDFLGRSVVWGLKKGDGDKTILLTGHYDCVEIDCYGALKDYALKPDILREKLKEKILDADTMEDINSGEWMFGRGMNDMKDGIAINLWTILNTDVKHVNLLFVAVHDEENMSSGMRQSIALLNALKEKYNLKYELMLLTEAHERQNKDRFKIYTGTVGKLMPSIVVKGCITHASDVLSGMNSSFLLSDIVSRLELNTDFCSEKMGVSTQPPTVLFMRDLKESYDVSVPEYSGCYLNYQYLDERDAGTVLDKIKAICTESVDESIDKYQVAFDSLCDNGFVDKSKKKVFETHILTFEELEKAAKGNNADYIDERDKLYKDISQDIQDGVISMQNAGVRLIKEIIKLSGLDGITVVVGFIPPFYPACLSSDINDNIYEYVDVIEKGVNERGLKLDKESYFMGICDISYAASSDTTLNKGIMNNLVTPKNIYDIDFDKIEKLNIPAIVLGPWGKNYHTMTERVYMKDVEETIPELINSIIRYAEEK